MLSNYLGGSGGMLPEILFEFEVRPYNDGIWGTFHAIIIISLSFVVS